MISPSSLRVSELVRRADVTVLAPPRAPYLWVIAMLLAAALGAVGWALVSGLGAMTFPHWVALLFGALVALMLLMPRSWQAWRLAELGWDAQQLYLLDGGRDMALALPRSALQQVHLERQVGHQGEWLGFALDLQLSEAMLAQGLALLRLAPEQAYQVAPDVYRFAFHRAWQRPRRLRSILAPLRGA